MQIKTEGDKYDKNFGKKYQRFRQRVCSYTVLYDTEVIVETIIPFLMSSMIDDGINKGDMQHILITGGYMGALALTGLFAGMMGGIYGAKASAGFARNLRRSMFANIQSFSFANIDRYSTAGLVTRMTTDVTNLQNAYQMLLRMCFRALYRSSVQWQ